MEPGRLIDGITPRKLVRFEIDPFGASPGVGNISRFPVCGSRFPTIRCASRGPPPRSEFKAYLRVVSPTRLPEHFGVVGWLTRLEQSVSILITLEPQTKPRLPPPSPSSPEAPLRGFSFLASVNRISGPWAALPALPWLAKPFAAEFARCVSSGLPQGQKPQMLWRSRPVTRKP